MLNKHNLNVAKAISKQESRFTLNAIRVTPQETVATDGHILVRVSTPPAKAEDFPEVAGQPAATDDFAPFNLPAQSALEAAKLLSRRTLYPVLQNAAVAVNGHAQIMTTDLENARAWKAAEGTYLDYARVIPDPAQAQMVIRLNAALLKTICEQAIGFNKDQPFLTFYIERPDRVVYFRMEGGDEQTLDGAIAPIRPD